MKNYHPITDGMTIIHHNSIAHNVSNPEKSTEYRCSLNFLSHWRFICPCPEAAGPVYGDPLQSVISSTFCRRQIAADWLIINAEKNKEWICLAWWLLGRYILIDWPHLSNNKPCNGPIGQYREYLFRGPNLFAHLFIYNIYELVAKAKPKPLPN